MSKNNDNERCGKCKRNPGPGFEGTGYCGYHQPKGDGNVAVEKKTSVSSASEQMVTSDSESDVVDRALTVFPEGEIGEDNDGQVIIYTNIYSEDEAVYLDVMDKAQQVSPYASTDFDNEGQIIVYTDDYPYGRPDDEDDLAVTGASYLSSDALAEAAGNTQSLVASGDYEAFDPRDKPSVYEIKELAESVEDRMMVYPEYKAKYAHATVIYALTDMLEDRGHEDVSDEDLAVVLNEMNPEACYERVRDVDHLDVYAALTEMNEAFYRVHPRT